MMRNSHLKGNGDGVIDHRKACMMSNNHLKGDGGHM